MNGLAQWLVIASAAALGQAAAYWHVDHGQAAAIALLIGIVSLACALFFKHEATA